MGTSKATASPPAKRKAKAAPAPEKSEDDVIKTFASISRYLLDMKDVSMARMFGSSCLKVGGKVFAVCYKGRLVLKLSAESVDGLVQSGRAVLFDPGHGRVSKEWVSVGPEPRSSWLKLATSAREFVSTVRR